MRFARLLLPLWLGLLHGLVDAGTAWLLFSQLSLPQGAALFVLFNLIGFALQPLAGYWVDQKWGAKTGLLAGLALLVPALLLPLELRAPALVLAALGSAFFHVSGGSLSLQTKPLLPSSALFSAPGVLGLALGTVAALDHLPLGPLMSGLLALSGVGLAVYLPSPTKARPAETEPVAAWQESLILVLILAIALRSLLWNNTYAHWESFHGSANATLILGLGLSAALGKLAGGLAATYWGQRQVALGSLCLALPCLWAGAAEPWLWMLGVAALQSSTPLTLAALGRLLPRQTALAAGLAQGFAIALGGVPALIGLSWYPGPLTLMLVGGSLVWLFYQAFSRFAPKLAGSPETV